MKCRGLKREIAKISKSSSWITLKQGYYAHMLHIIFYAPQCIKEKEVHKRTSLIFLVFHWSRHFMLYSEHMGTPFPCKKFLKLLFKISLTLVPFSTLCFVLKLDPATSGHNRKIWKFNTLSRTCSEDNFGNSYYQFIMH